MGSTHPLTKMCTWSIFSWQTRSVRKADKLIQSWAIITLSGNLRFVEASRHLWPVMGLIYLSQDPRSRFAFLRLLGSPVRMCFVHGYFSHFGVVCLSVRCLRPADHFLEYSYWILMCECLILRKLVPSKVSRFWSKVGFCVNWWFSNFFHFTSTSCPN